MNYAKVIVDVPTAEMDRPFDYVIPAEMKPLIEVGSRVGVSFGPRVLQGFVVAITEVTDLKPDKIKPIQALLDVDPPLPPDLVELAEWLSSRYLCHKITALQAMVPTALKGKSTRKVSLSEKGKNAYVDKAGYPAEAQPLIDYLYQQQAVKLEALIAAFPSISQWIKPLLKTNMIELDQKIVDALGTKKVLVAFPTLSRDELQAEVNRISEKSFRQREILQHFIDNPREIKLSELLGRVQASHSTVKSLEAKGWLTIAEKEELRDPFAHRSFPQTSPLRLTEGQQAVYFPICDALTQFRHQSFLLHGVTGSGKTEIYLQSIALCLEQGRQAIVLVPEISLTPQMVDRFKGRFGDRVAVLHSRLSAGERYDEWRKIHRGYVDVVVGARSAIFAPFRQIGLIIVDEEHEGSYKQEDHPKYHARDVAVKRAEMHQAVVVLGSATPSLESYQATVSGRFKLLEIPYRVGGRPMPPIRIIDMRSELRDGNRSMFSGALREAIADRWKKNEQSVLFLNRRGFSTFVMCRSCGLVKECPHCDISLTFHQNNRSLRCHYCGFTEPEPKACPQCDSEHIRFFGTGTQRVEEELGKLFPGLRVIRMDVDTTTQKGSHEKWLTMFGKGQADVLLGTQMVAKGLDFPKVTLVGVIAADTILNLPDFRAAEKTFQLLTQVAGRAGRHELPGEVIIQTYTPEHYSIEMAAAHEYLPFFKKERALRHEHQYPPFCRIALITLFHENVAFIAKSGQLIAQSLRQSCHGKPVQLFGPVPSPLPKLKDKYRYQLMIKYANDYDLSGDLQYALQQVEEEIKRGKLQISVDIDPQMLM